MWINPPETWEQPVTFLGHVTKSGHVTKLGQGVSRNRDSIVSRNHDSILSRNRDTQYKHIDTIKDTKQKKEPSAPFSEREKTDEELEAEGWVIP
jgi:hypothetical protein